MTSLEKTTKELTLLLLYLNSWEEKALDETYRRSWKGYDFGDLNELSGEELIFDPKRSKSIIFNDSGIKQAKALAEKYGVDVSAFEPASIKE